MPALPGFNNPLLDKVVNPAVDLEVIQAKTVHRKNVKMRKRELRSLRRKETAVESIYGLAKDIEIFGFTKGQFSLIELIDAVLDVIGPAFLSVSTWTAAHTDVTNVLQFMESGRLTGSRWLVDFTFQRRSPELAQKIRELFGADAVRVARNHAKFSLLRNSEWDIVIRTSMNLNTNPRFEDFTIAHDPELAEFLQAILDDVWKRQKVSLAFADRPQTIKDFFKDEM